jgi:hypothetical protein
MILVDYLMKWFKTKKNLYSLGAFIVIMLLMAWNFSYWAGEIQIKSGIIGSAGGSQGEGEEENWVYQLDVEEDVSGTLLIPSAGVFQSEDLSIAIIEFEVKETAVLGFVNVTVSSTRARPDFDLEVFGPNGESVGESKTEEADESIQIKEKQFNKTGPGTYKAQVENYSSFYIQYSLTIRIYIKVPLEEGEAAEGD